MKYLSLGDSIASGEETFASLIGEVTDLDLVNLAVGGSTIPNVFVEQLPKAVALLGEKDVEVITLVIGANDANGSLTAILGDDDFAQKAADLAERIETQLDGLLLILRAIAPDVRLALLSYYNPYKDDDPMQRFASVMLDQLTFSLNNIIRRVAQKYNADVIDMGIMLNHEDVVGEVSFEFEGEEVTFYDIHPNAEGQRKIAALVLNYIGRERLIAA